ncbi:MAG: hypothetical protein ACR2JE_11705 [Acidobacteriaceae bacterium]
MFAGALVLRVLGVLGVLGMTMSAVTFGTVPANALPMVGLPAVYADTQDVPDAPEPAIFADYGAHDAMQARVKNAADAEVPNHERTGRKRMHGGVTTTAGKPGTASNLRYHWKGLLWQSFAFNLAMNGFRVADDATMRDQLAHKPYWHDYIASIKQFNMRRWNDGDDFLVNYVGHPLEGSVASFIEIQNSPTQARIRWNQPGYMNSRFKAFLWSLAFSTQSEIGPLGEAGIGSEGGFTYGTKCFEHCTPGVNFKPGDHYTNNTGWVDFIITPTVGMLWVFAEDFLDKDVSDRVSGGDRTRDLSRVVHGALNPSRTFANFLRGRNPWYRDWDHPIGTPVQGDGVRFLKSDEWTAREQRRPRFEISPHVTGFSIATNTRSCTNCRAMTTGAGVEGSVRLLRWLDADADVSYLPNASPLPSDRAGGNMLTGFFGVRSGIDTENYALKLAVRPGFVRFDRAYQTSPTSIILRNNALGPVSQYPGTEVQNPPPTVGDITHFAWNFNLTGDYKVTDSVAFRAGIGENLVRYRSNFVNPPGIGEPPYVSWLAKENFINRGKWSYQVGPVFSF